MFVWITHRITGLVLFVTISFKIFTAFFMMTKQAKPDWAILLHTNPVIDTLLIVAAVFHGLYGIRTVIIDLGIRKEKPFFWIFSSIGVLLSAALIILYYTRNY